MIKRYLMGAGDIQLSAHFRLHEFQSRNGWDEVLVDEALIDMLEKIYKHFNCSKAVINDGFRQPGEYCRSIGGSDRDAHAYGMAADVVFFDSEGDVISGRYICCYAQDIGVQGIGYMGNAVHLDTRGNGGYKNTHWWGDETTGATVTDWHSYFAITNYPAAEPDENEEDSTENQDESANTDAEDGSSSDNNVTDFDGGDIMTRDISKNQLKYEVNRYALTVLGREIGDADTYVELLSTGQLDWYEFTKRLQESEEAVKRWIKYTLFVDILNRVPDASEVAWWYAQYSLRYEVNKALMAERFAEDYEKFKDEYMNKPL